MPREVSDYVVKAYVRLRKSQKEQEDNNKTHSYTSARTLLGVLRLAQALARIRFVETVEIPDVDEALRLMEVSKESLLDDEDKERESDQSELSVIYRLIKDMASGGPTRIGKGSSGETDMDIDVDASGEELSMVDIRARCQAKGHTETAIMDTILQVNTLKTLSV